MVVQVMELDLALRPEAKETDAQASYNADADESFEEDAGPVAENVVTLCALAGLRLCPQPNLRLFLKPWTISDGHDHPSARLCDTPRVPNSEKFRIASFNRGLGYRE